MEKRIEILEALTSVLGDRPGLAVVHSSLASLAPEGGVKRWDFLYAVKELVSRGWTLAFPSFTFSFCRDGIFDPQLTASETGIIADWVLADLVGARRTDHPIYSFVVLGADADEFYTYCSETTFGDSSPFKLFEQKNAHLVMLGSGWKYATPFHRYEEKAEVSYRIFKMFTGNKVIEGEPVPVSALMYVRDLEINAENDFSPLVKRLRDDEQIKTASLWRATVEATTMEAIRERAECMLSDDALAFVSNPAEVQYRLDMRGESQRLEPYRVAVLGMSNLDIVVKALDENLSQLIPDRRFSTYVAPFGQVYQQVMEPNSALNSFKPELTIFADRLEDLLGVDCLDLANAETIIDAVKQHAALIQGYATGNGGTILVHRFALLGQHSVEKLTSLSGLVAKCNNILSQSLEEIENTYFLDMGTEVAQGIAVHDARLWYIGRIPFSEPFTRHLAERWSAIILFVLGKTARLLVLDLDNTLWGGVLGEDGIEGISIGGDFPGNAYLSFQKTLKAFSDRGVALAVCSKNDEDLALKVLSDHEDIVIRPETLVAHRINWKPKWQNIREIAAELDLGLGSVLFIDDNPVEREAVKRNLPMVKVLDLPQDPTGYRDALLNSPYVESLSSGKEDQKRVVSYKARRKIKLEQQAAASVEDFLTSLEMQLHVKRLNSSNLSRAAQLCQKTNQFNTTGRRYTARDLEDMASEGTDVAVIGLQDKYSDLENIGVIILRSDEVLTDIGNIDLFLLSCRVLGRTVESAALTWALSRAYARGWSILNGEVIELPRNTPARNVFSDNGFIRDTGKKLWQKTAAVEKAPDWFEIHDGFD